MNLCSSLLKREITSNQLRLSNSVLQGLKLTSKLETSYPNLYLILRLLPPLQPTDQNISKFTELYPYFISACRERNSMYPEGFFLYKAKHEGLSVTNIRQLSNLEIPKTIILHHESPFCTYDFPLDTYTSYIYEHNPFLKTFKSHINVNYGEKNTSRYYPDEDIFKITINTHECKNHQFLSLVHHLGYVLFWIQKFQEQINPYTLGKIVGCQAALAFDRQTLQNISKDLYNEFLSQEHQMVDLLAFEIDLYRNLPKTPKTIFRYRDLRSPYLFLSQEQFFTQPLEKCVHVASFLSV